MRKFIFAFLISVISVPVMADNWIKFKAQAVENAINTLVEESKRQAVADEYQKQMNQATGMISVMGIYKVCAIAGMNINTGDGYSRCRYFVNKIADDSGFGTQSATQANCVNKFNGVWTLNADDKAYQCVGKDGYVLIYKRSCNGDGGECIKIFAGLQTQEPNGREFIEAYAKKKNLKLTCRNGFETRRGITSPLGQDYIRCSVHGKAYEFEFDDLNQDPGTISVESENKMMCEFFGGKIVKDSDSDIEKRWQSCQIASSICNKDLYNFALRIGHNAQYQGICRLARDAKSTNYANLNTIKGVDSHIFYNSGAQMRAGMAKVQLEEYLRKTFPNESNIVCNSTVKKFEYGLGLDQDYVMTCTVGSKRVDFLFDDLTEGSKRRADTGMDAMQCITNGGKFKGETCRGPTQAECDNLDTVLRAKGSTEGAKWDDKARACILGNAMKTYKVDVATNYIVGAVVIIGGTVMVIATDGLTAPVVVEGVGMLLGDIAVNTAIDLNHRRLTRAAANRFGDFLDAAEKCKDEKCALKTLEKHYASLSGVISDLNTDDQAVVTETMDKLVRLIKTEFIACGKDDNGRTVYASAADCAKQISKLRAIDYIDQISEPALIIFSVVYNPGFVTSRFLKIKKISRIAKDLNITYKEAKKFMSTLENLRGLRVNRVDKVKDNGHVSVFKFTDATSGRVYYLKHTDEMDEIARTKRAYKILNNKSDIVHTVNIVEDDQKILTDFATRHELDISGGKYWFLMDEMPGSETATLMVNDAPNALQTVLRNKPITIAEQDEILRAIEELNANGIVHGDLGSNMFFMREPNGKLRVDIIDYEPWSAAQPSSGSDIETVKKMFRELSETGLADVTKINPTTTGAMFDINALTKKISANFDYDVQSILNGRVRARNFQKNSASDAEWAELNEYLNKQGLEIIDDGPRYKKMQKIGFSKSNDSPELNALMQRIDENFATKYGYIESGSSSSVSFPKDRATEAEWAQLNEYLNKRGLEIVDSGPMHKRMQKIGVSQQITKADEAAIFSKVYNNYLSDDVIQAKLRYVYENSQDVESAIIALKKANIYDEAKTIQLANDLADEAVQRIKVIPGLTERMKRYRSLTNEERIELMKDLHGVITTERRPHVGNTQIVFDLNTNWSSVSGLGTADNGFVFKYGLNLDSVEGMIAMAFHENTHALQRLGKSALPYQFAEWNLSHYVNHTHKLYYDNIIEIEAYAIQKAAARRVMLALGLY